MWLHSPVGRALHQYRGGHRVESRRSLDFFRFLLSNCFNWKIYCDDHSSLSSTTAVKYHFTPHGIYEPNKSTSLPMSGFIAQLVEHRTGIAEVTVSNPVEALIFFSLLLSNCLNWKIYCDDHSSLTLINTDSPLTEIQVYENLA